jgi:anti-anti-sigma factor
MGTASPPAAEAPTGLIVVEVVGPLDLATAMGWEARIEAAAEDAGVVLVDLSHSGFVDSAGIRALLRVRATLDAGAKELVLVAPPGGRARRLLELLGLTALATVCSSRAGALGMLSRGDRVSVRGAG